jgi:hypothetical protein
LEVVSATIFGLALVHTFAASWIAGQGHRSVRHAGLFHLLGEVEIVFGFWSFVLMAAMALLQGGAAAVAYAESRQYTEPLFVFVVMVVAASRPVLVAVDQALAALARLLPLPTPVAQAWLVLAVVPLLGSWITEPAAMTLAALILVGTVFGPTVPERLKYAALGALFVNVSVGGTLTSFAAPPVLMVATTWQWDSAFMLTHFGWKAATAVLINATVVTFLLRRHLPASVASAPGDAVGPSATGGAPGLTSVPWVVTAVHFGLLALVVEFAHHPVVFLGIFMLFLGYTQAYERFQNPLIIREGLLVGFFLAGLVVLGGMQEWWLQPIVAGLAPTALFFGALGLTAVTDNAALTYLGSLTPGLSDAAKYMLVAGAVGGGGLTVIANAPNPAGAALLRRGFTDESISAVGLLLGALPPTAVAAALLYGL